MSLLSPSSMLPLDGPPGSRRVATGVVINTRGDVLSIRIDRPLPGLGTSSAHRDGDSLIVARDASGERHSALWIAADPETGLTLLRIAPRVVKPIQLATDSPSLGGQVFVVGNPLGLGHSVSRGHIAGLDRALKLGPRQLGGLIQIQAPLYPGDSGAVVANLRGQLLGLIRSGLAIQVGVNERAERDNDFGFAIPARDLLWIADQLRARGRVDRAYLGVRLEPMERPLRSGSATSHATGQPSEAVTEPPMIEGARLQEVIVGTPAARAGLMAGDLIVALDGQPVRSSHDLTDRLDRLPAQTSIRLEVIRTRGLSTQRINLVMQSISRPDPGPPLVHSPAPSQSQPEPGEPGSSSSPAVVVVPTASAGLASSSPTRCVCEIGSGSSHQRWKARFDAQVRSLRIQRNITM